MLGARVSCAAALAVIAALLVPAVSATAQEEDAAAIGASDIPDVPYTRWLYGLDGSRLPALSLNDGLALRYGSPADGMPYDHVISLQADIRAVTVTQNETVRFVTPEGQEFQWKFDTPRTVVSLSRIAPPDLTLGPNVAVFVATHAANDRS